MAEEPRKPSATYGAKGPSAPVDAQSLRPCPLCNERSGSAYGPTYSAVTGAVHCNYPGCTMVGPELLTEIDACAAWNAIASLYDEPYSRPYPWRSEKPTQPGWYVFKFHHLRLEPDAMQSICLQIVIDEGQLFVQPDDDEAELYELDELADGLWKGPLDLENL